MQRLRALSRAPSPTLQRHWRQAPPQRMTGGRARSRRCLGDGTDLRGAARTLEIFLDRLAWRSLQTGELAAEYFLDQRYAAGASAGDRVLRSALGRFTDELTTSCDRGLAGDWLAEGRTDTSCPGRRTALDTSVK